MEKGHGLLGELLRKLCYVLFGLSSTLSFGKIDVLYSKSDTYCTKSVGKMTQAKSVGKPFFYRQDKL